MKVAYCSLLLPEEKHLAERAKERLSGISLHKFTRAVIEGLDQNLEEPVTVFNIINTLNYPKFPDLVFKTERWHHKDNSDDWHIGYINLIAVKYITQAYNLYRKLDQWVRNFKDEPCIVCVHHIYFPSMCAALKLKRKYGRKIQLCLITGDMNGKFGLASQYKANLKSFLLKFVERKIDRMAKDYDCFVFATKNMAEAFEVEKKPFTVVECAYIAPPDSEKAQTNSEDETKKIIFYAGAIRREYGIIHLLKAFAMIEGSEYRLWLAGDGNAVPDVQSFAKEDSRVEYLGFLTPKQVDECQRKASVLISPRVAGNYEYVKYSFPSKTMECLASGKPYIAHKLPCDPPEYSKYIQYAESESDESLKNKIVEICSLSENERQRIGKEARRFILQEKNPVMMTKHIITMWEKMLKIHYD
ncbi:UNVERIFIED_ORG: hypothetical protein B5F06_06670 [Lacrimispora saccharolytica]